MGLDLTSEASIRDAASLLMNHLASARVNKTGTEWTEHNFTRLRDFFANETDVACHHRPQRNSDEDIREFMWDFLAIRRNGGVLLAAESEQVSKNLQDLKHDFEKLLYVFAPIRIFITKVKSADDAKDLASKLSEYAGDCCAHFNPGSVFILYFDLGKDLEPISYLWQSEGKPLKPQLEKLDFKQVIC